MDKIARIRAEIERRIDILTNVYAEQVERKDEEMMNYYHGKVIALEELRPFLNTLSEEPDKSLEVDLEKEMEKFGESWPYPASFDGYDKDWVDELTEECAKHFYELGKKDMKQQMLKDNPVILSTEDFQALIDSHAKRVEADYKEKMLKDAVEGEVYLYHSYNRDATAILVDIPKENLGDKVRIIVVKAEEE